MFNRSRLFIVSIVFAAAMVFGQGLFSSPAEAMTEMADWELSMITAGRYLYYTTGPPKPPEVTPPAMNLDTLTIDKRNARYFVGDISSSPAVTIKGLNGTLWAMEKATIGFFNEEPISLWLVIDVFKARRSYFDMGLERYGWELVDADYSKVLRKQHDAINLTGAEGKPVTVDKIIHQITYEPIPREWVTLMEETYFLGKTFQGWKTTKKGQECFYRRGYWIVYQY